MKKRIPWMIAAALLAALVWSHRDMLSNSNSATAAQKKQPDAWQKGWAVYDAKELLEQRRKKGRAYMPFLRTPALYCGIYALPKNGKDGQSPHKHDEVYYVLGGTAKFETGVGDKKNISAVKKGGVIYVKAGMAHRFLDISDDLELLVFFSTKDVGKTD